MLACLTRRRDCKPGMIAILGCFVCHKMFDAVGDLALAGAPMLCACHSFRVGHRQNHGVLRAQFAD